MNKKNEEKSPAYQFVAHLYRNSEKCTGHSWTRLNQCLRRALNLAIEAGLRFDLDDFNEIVKNFNGGYWYSGGEGFYSTAVQVRHINACQAYEHFRDRKPYILDGERVYIGRQIIWDGERGDVTSIDAERFILTIPRGWNEDATNFDRTPKRLIKISHADLKEHHAQLRAKQKAAEETKKIHDAMV